MIADAARRVHWTKPVEFLDKELQEVVRDAQLGKLRADKLVRVERLDGREEWLLIHIEVQGLPEQQLQALNSDQPDRLAEALLHLPSPAELEAWLRHR